MKLSLGKDSGKGISISAGGRVSVGGDVVQGDKTVNVTNLSTSSEELSKLFADIYKKIEARPADPNVDKEEVKQDVRRIEEEVKKGEEANASDLGSKSCNELDPACC